MQDHNNVGAFNDKKEEYCRHNFKMILNELAQLHFEPFTKTIYIHYFENKNGIHSKNIECLAKDLKSVGIPFDKILYDKWHARPGSIFMVGHYPDHALEKCDIVFIVGSEDLAKNYETKEDYWQYNILCKMAYNNTEPNKKILIPVWFDGEFEDIFPLCLQCHRGQSLVDYYDGFFSLLESIYQLDPVDNVVKKIQKRFKHIMDNTDFYEKYVKDQAELKAKEREEAIKKIDKIFGL